VSDEIIGMYEVLDAVCAAISSADPEARAALAKAMDGYAEYFPEEFDWAISAQSPSLLCQLVIAIDSSCRPNAPLKPRPPIRLVDLKSHQQGRTDN
jgi:hypothetical protein